MTCIDGPEKLQALECALRELEPDFERHGFVDTASLHRYLRARKGDVKAAARMLHATLKWRKAADLSSLSVSEFPEELASGKMFVAGHD
ncbi:predicted protein, partial [Haematococcus lacustris]